MRCKTCQYPLTGLSEHRCPECGNAFDPNDADTLYNPRLVQKRVAFSFFAGYATCFILVLARGRMRLPMLVETAILAMFWVMTAFAVLVLVGSLMTRLPPRSG